MRLSKLLAAVAISSLMTAPAIAGPASTLSVANAAAAGTSAPVRASTSSKKSNDLAGLLGGSGLLIGAIGVAVVVAGIVVVASDDDDADSN
jgi:hypothetical protein